MHFFQPYSLPHGWYKIRQTRKNNSTKNYDDVYVMAPCGKRFRSNVEIDNYISAKKSKAIKTSSKKYKEYLLPYDWKKVALKSKNSDRWVFYVLSPQGKKLRSNIEIRKYLEVNPDIKCDRNVTNTSKKMVQIDSESEISGDKGTEENKSVCSEFEEESEEESDKESEEEGLEYVPKKGKRGPPAARSAISAKKVANEESDTESDKESEEEFPKNRKRRAPAVRSAILAKKSKVTESSSKKMPAKKSNSVKSDSESEEEIAPVSKRATSKKKPVAKKSLPKKPAAKKNFQCDLCNYVSARKDNLKKHVQSVHEKLKPYNCRQCGKAFSMKQHCKEHEESIHDGITHSCDFCEMICTTKGHLRTHIKKVHNEIG